MTIDPPGRTFTVACPYCAVDVVTKPQSIRIDSGLYDFTASVDFIGRHRCGEPKPIKTEETP